VIRLTDVYRDGIALDPSVGEVHAEHLVGFGNVQRVGDPLRVDDPLCHGGSARVASGGLADKAVSESEDASVDERRRASGRFGIEVNAAVHDQRVEFLDRRQPPIGVAAVGGGVERGRKQQGVLIRQFIVVRERAVEIRVRTLHPCQASNVVVNGQSIGA